MGDMMAPQAERYTDEVDPRMKTYEATVIRVRRTEVVYTAVIQGIRAESEDDARRKAELALARLPGIKDERWWRSDPETTLGPPEIIHVEDEAELAALLSQIWNPVSPQNEEATTVGQADSF